MKKSIMWLVVVGLVASLLIPGCAKAPPAELPPVLTLATHAIGSKFNAMGSGIASVLSAHLATEVKVMPTTGPVEWTPQLRTEEVDMGIANCGDAKWAWLALSAYKEALKGVGAPIRLLTNGSPNIISIIVAEDSGIKTGKDLKGKKMVTTYTGSPSLTAQGLAALANLGLKPEDVIQVSVPGIADGVRAIIEGRADAAGTAAIGTGVVAELDTGRGARFLSLDPSPEAVKRAQEIWPCEVVKVEPTVGVKEPTYMMSYDTYLMCRTTLSDETAYLVVKTLWDYNSELWPIHVGLKGWTTDRFVAKPPTIPYHSGAIKFYKEKGVWTSEVDKIQEELLKLEK